MSLIEKQTLRRDLTPGDMLKVIFDYTAKIADEKNLDRLLMLMADMGREMVVADRCTLWLYDKMTDELWTKVAHDMEEVRVPATAGVVGHAILTGQPEIIEDAYQDARFNQEIDRQTGYRTQSL
ncbi:MAG TPA: GAF domain-containing protein, partial [Bacilli bacterium]|nr:GAF domain-containing protein [Bacilli bacterium]